MLFYVFTVLFCWPRFWDFAGQDFMAHYPVTYFVLYVSLLALGYLAGV